MKLELDYQGIIDALSSIKKQCTWKELASELGLSEYQTKKLVQKKDFNLLPDSAILLLTKHSYNINDFLVSDIKSSNHYTAMLALKLNKIKSIHSQNSKFDDSFLRDIKSYINHGKTYLSKLNSNAVTNWIKPHHILYVGKHVVEILWLRKQIQNQYASVLSLNGVPQWENELKNSLDESVKKVYSDLIDTLENDLEKPYLYTLISKTKLVTIDTINKNDFFDDYYAENAFISLSKKVSCMPKSVPPEKEEGRKYTVTGRIKSVGQPYGGYIKPSEFMKISMENDVAKLNDHENISPSLMGLSVDYLTRLMTGSTAKKAFEISLRGAKIIGKSEFAEKLVENVNGLDDNSIKNAVQLTTFDCYYRAGPFECTPHEEIQPDNLTIENIRTLVKRTLEIFKIYGPKTMDGLTFEGGYTDRVVAGDGDFMTENILWDLKVSKRTLSKDQILQIIMYWRMGLHSVHPEYKKIRYLCVFNPRLNVLYKLPVENISQEIIDEIEVSVIGYDSDDTVDSTY